MTRPRTGLYGGSFDPIHLGHLIVADHVCEALGLDRMIFIPAGQSPLKKHVPGAIGSQRREMIELSIAHCPRFQISTVELDRKGQSFTVDTLRELRGQIEGDLYFLMGDDQIRDLHRWRSPDEILALAHVVGMSRPDYDRPDPEALSQRFPTIKDRLILVDVPAIEISSSDLRRRRAEGRSIEYRVLPAVKDYIDRHGLYRPA
jgi:nicotinate-nucleotide adenylyltransferase